MQNTLLELGFSKPEIEVYLSLLELGGAHVAVLSKRAEIERTNCYYILKQLADRGLVTSVVKRNAKYYVAESPNKLVSECQKRLEDAKLLVPKLLALENTRTIRGPQVRTYETRAGVRDVFLSSLNSSRELLRYTNLERLRTKYPKLALEYFSKLSRSTVHCRIISSYNKNIQEFVREVVLDTYLKSRLQILYVNPNEFCLEYDVLISEDMVYIISLSKDGDHATVIDSPVYANTSRASYELAWLGASRFEAK